MQEERRQRVVSTGVYSLVRHPLYLGASLYIIGGSILMSSIAGLIAGVIFMCVLAARSVGEESMLRTELDGYDDYMKKVRWRLIPFIF
jgi:protein-S-isoprenylcysteine O-methyltransferase Ste14